MAETLVLKSIMRAHTDVVTAIAISIDKSNIIITASCYKSIILGDINKDGKSYGGAHRRLTGNVHFIEDVVLSSNGGHALSGILYGELRLWNLATGVSIRFVGHTDDCWELYHHIRDLKVSDFATRLYHQLLVS